MREAFDDNKYIKIQSEHILERISKFDNKLYLEFGGKLFDDNHASRVLPGFKPDSKVQMLKKIASKTEFIIAANAKDIQTNKVRSDNGLTYEDEVLRLIKTFKSYGIKKGSVVITRYVSNFNVDAFMTKLSNQGIPVYKHYSIDGYPYNVDFTISDDGFGKNEFVVTEKPLVIVTAPGPGSGKMATCMSQLYNEYRHGVKAGYAKYETFPIWNIPLKHPVNLAYEAATVDLADINMIDSFHLSYYGVQTVNYNRDIEVFPVVKRMFEKIYGTSPYNSPTDMGVNMAGYCIYDDEAAIEASKEEIIRRYYDTVVKVKLGKFNKSALDKITVIMNELGLSGDSRKCALHARNKNKKTNKPSFAIELSNGDVISGKETDIFSSPAACLLNALKKLAGIKKEFPLLSPTILNDVISLKSNFFDKNEHHLHVNEVLIVLSVSAQTNTLASAALSHLEDLKGCEGHGTKIIDYSDELYLKRLGINVTFDANFE